MKSLQESLLDDNILDNTNIDSILISTFPKKQDIQSSNNFMPYYDWESSYFKNICKYNIDKIKVYWVNYKDIVNIIKNQNKDLISLTVIFENSKNFNIKFQININSLNIKNNNNEYKEEAYYILNMIKDNIYNIDKVINYIKTHKERNLTISQKKFEDLIK